ELELAGAVHARRLDEEDLAAHARPREAGRDAGLRGALGDLARVARRAEELVEIVFVVDPALRRVALGHLHRDAADDARDLTLERTNAGLASVVVDDLFDRFVGDLDLLDRETVLP